MPPRHLFRGFTLVWKGLGDSTDVRWGVGHRSPQQAQGHCWGWRGRLQAGPSAHGSSWTEVLEQIQSRAMELGKDWSWGRTGSFEQEQLRELRHSV